MGRAAGGGAAGDDIAKLDNRRAPGRAPKFSPLATLADAVGHPHVGAGQQVLGQLALERGIGADRGDVGSQRDIGGGEEAARARAWW